MHRVLVAAAVLCVTACGRTPAVTIEVIGGPRPAAIEVHGLPSSDLRALAGANLTDRDWQSILTVTAAFGPGQAPNQAGQLPMAGQYRVEGAVVRFTPMFGFDAGGAFGVRFDPAKIPGAEPTQAFEVMIPTSPPERPVKRSITIR